MKSLFALVSVVVGLAGAQVRAEGYATEALVTLDRETKRFEAFGVVSKLTEHGSEIKEEIISRPRIVSSQGAPATMYVGSARGAKGYNREENITMDVSWPENAGETAICTITVRRGDKVISKSTTKVSVQEK